MADDDLIRTIRARADDLRFESPTRGAIALQVLRWGLPASERIPGLDEAQIAFAIVRRTIRHSHQVSGGPDQYGGWSVVFSRHVSEGDQRWDFEVEVTVVQGQAAIADVRVIRPGDDVPDPDDPDAEPVPPRAPLTDADLLPHGMLACPCCGHATLSERGMYQICPVCFWEDDGQDSHDADVDRGGPNRVSLRRGRASYLAIGANVEADRAHTRGPTREEVPLRRFDAEGNEVTWRPLGR
jgi:hypothetical protein